MIGSVAFIAAVVIFSQHLITEAAWETASITSSPQLPRASWNRAKVEAIKVKGLYLTAYSAGNPAKINEIIKLVSSTELNAIVIDVKDYSGYVLYNSQLPFVNKLKLKSVRIKDLSALAAKLRQNNIYAIARISSFQDPLLAEKKTDWAIKSKKGGLWRDKKGLAWVDPTNRNVWKYVASIAKEATEAGFDEINFDYIRFPTDGPMNDIIYTNGGQKRREVIANFFKFMSAEFQDAPVYLSADLFGLTTEKSGEDDMMIGQRLSDAVKYFDYVCPMVYPSHYPPNYLNYKNPADHPYEVVFHAMTAGMKQAVGARAHLRSWIQDFNMGAIYDGAKVRAEIKASDDAGADGWILWNAANRYDSKGLLAE